LKEKVYPDHVRCLLSLRPSDTLSTAIKNLKGSASHGFCGEFGLPSPLWARGFLARGIGRVRIAAVRDYLDRQAEHHGYASRTHPPVFRYQAREKTILTAAHSSFDLNHHLVFATRYRRGVFGSQTAEALVGYWLAVAKTKGFAIDRASVLPDHSHLLVRIVPKQSIDAVVLSLMNNAQHWSGKYFPQLLNGEDQLWQHSAYAGTCGEVTTAMVKSFLGQEL
jgi:putative transposase